MVTNEALCQSPIFLAFYVLYKIRKSTTNIQSFIGCTIYLKTLEYFSKLGFIFYIYCLK